MNKDNTDMNNDLTDGSINFEEACLSTQKLIELYDQGGDYLDNITPEDVTTLLNAILEEDLDDTANKFGQDSDMYWKVVALRVVAHVFKERVEKESIPF